MEEQSLFEAFDLQNKPLKRRRKLLPLWIKVFIWIFFFAAFITILILAFGFFLTPFDLSLFGLKTEEIYTPTGIFICILYLYKGAVSYGLWFEKDWGPKAGIIDAFVGFLVCISVMVIIPFFTTPHFNLRLEILILIPYLRSMQKLEYSWKRT